jgi:hypothetical protein
MANWELFQKSLVDKITILSNSPNCLNCLKPANLAILRNRSILEGPKTTIPTQELDNIAEALTSAILYASNTSIPRTRTSKKSKPWWNENLRYLRKTMTKLGREKRLKPTQARKYQDAKNTYFNAIKHAKIDHWNQFLSKEDPKSIFKAMAYTKDVLYQPIPNIRDPRSNTLKSDFKGQCQTLRETLFPEPPETPKPEFNGYKEDPNWEWPSLSKIEVQEACTMKIKGKSPGPDEITQEIITQAYNAIPEIFYLVFSILINTGYHPKCWKQATGIILKKPGKPDYSAPKAYRVISLLNCLGKISERILAKRLSYLAETTSLLHSSQIGGRLQKSAIDTALLLTNEVEQNKLYGYITTTLFLDIKGAFDHVAKNQLLAILKALGLPWSLISWVSSFLENRLLKLSFNQNTEDFKGLNTGIPQGSPISPILFLIYIRDLFKSPGIKYLSYIDDFSLTVASTSYKKNIKSLEREVTRLIEFGQKSAISFDIAKTELIHWNNSNKALEFPLTLPGGIQVQPQKLVK